MLRSTWAGLVAVLMSSWLQLGCEEKADTGEPLAQVALAAAGMGGASTGGASGTGGTGATGGSTPDPLPPKACSNHDDCGTNCQRCEAGQCVANAAAAGSDCGFCVNGGTCDASGACVGGTRQPASHVCRASAGSCDVAETCPAPGASDYRCGANAFRDAGVTCGAAPSGACDLQDTCDGSGSCVDRVAASNVKCRDRVVGNACDADDFCDGVAKTCADTFAPAGAACTDGNACTGTAGQADACNGSGSCVPGAAVVCTTTNACLQGATGVCNPTTGACTFAFQPSGHPCDDGVSCTQGDQCNGSGSCLPGTPTASLCPQSACAVAVCDTGTGCRLDAAAASGNLCRPAAGVCDVAEFCNGTQVTCPGDVFVSAGTQCQAPSCSAGVQVNEALCTGLGAACPTTPNVQCSPYACDGLVCGATCADDSDCLADFYCADTNVCEPRVGAGQPCTEDNQCTTSNPHCVDGVCCNAPCAGQCEACSVPGQLGTCSPTTGAPVGDRPACATDGSTCGGTCGGTLRAACVYPSTGVECQAPSCDVSTQRAVAAAACNGAGTCTVPAPVACEPYTCGPTSCRGDCVADAQCAAGNFCNAGLCEPRRGLGSTCETAAQCASGQCVDGVCCGSSCAGQCEACNLPGQAGTCSPVVGAPVGGRGACAGAGPCGGTCDGQNRFTCTYPGAGTACRNATCSGGTATLAASCDGGGNCPAPSTVACADGCDGALCAGATCAVNADCATGEVCRAGQCAPGGGLGTSCGSGAECASGRCVDGVCCESACTGQCEACNVAGSEGTCSPLPAGSAPVGSRPRCTSDGSVCAGACDGVARDRCAYPEGDVCRPGACNASGVATVEATCQGDGTCPTERTQDCGAFGCDAASEQCDGPCAADPTACAGTEFCSAGICVAKRDSGQSCGGDDECTSGHCVDGVCCDTPCDEQCAACNVPGALGTCAAVLGPARGGRAGCAGLGACGAQCDGTNPASCTFPGETTSCGVASCGNGAALAAPTCDGEGSCQTPTATRCDSLTCEGTQCGSGCTTDEQCLGDAECRDGSCVDAVLPDERDGINGRDQGTCGCKVPGGSAPASPWAPLAPLLGLTVLAWRRSPRRAATSERTA